MNKYIIKVDDDNKILSISYTFDYTEDDVELTAEEYEKAQHHRRFDIKSREFSEPIEVKEMPVELSEHEKITKEVYETTTVSADDNLLNMDLIAALDDKLTIIMEHLGISY